MAPSKSSIRIVIRSWRPAKIAASLQRFARSAPVRPDVWRAIWLRSTSSASGFPRVCTPQDRLAADQIGRRDQHLAVEAAGPEECGVEILEPVRGAHHDHLGRLVEAVELDEQLVQGLVVLAVEAAARAGRADGVELVDEDDRGRVPARLFEELADPGRRRGRRTSPRRQRRSASRTSRRTPSRPPSRAASCRCRAGRRAGSPSARARRGAGSASGSGGSRRPPAAPPSPPRRRRRPPTRPRSSRSPPASPASRAACTGACARADR